LDRNIEKQTETVHHDMRDVEEPAFLGEQTCLDIRIPAPSVSKPDEEE
jgi:hypothetical protein